MEVGARPEDTVSHDLNTQSRRQILSDLNVGPDEGKHGFSEGWLENSSGHGQGSAEHKQQERRGPDHMGF